ncbi:hypothetical protein [Paenibacillus monticola]|uniref:DNA-binding response regulator n=1 Tax=Paenibacillus monticola TaxID=2666075 RepID=A0A7X2H365_9BACL|nr:hypothetical protein [Paenibacillus monticola]MRN52530.1 hypothetical protein [Paenibacillus monticola]
MEFDEAHNLCIEQHSQTRTGERKGRLLRGHNFAEKLFLQKVWWPLFESLEHLHPEYEIYDWNRKSQFLDFAYLPQNGGRFGIECDGYQSHVKDMDREKFSYALNRDTFLTGMGWRMLHFSFDDIQQRPEVCRMLLQLVLAPYLARKSTGVDLLSLSGEKEVLRLAWRLGRAIRPKDVADHFSINFRTARKLLHSLCKKGLLKPVNIGERVRFYEVMVMQPGQTW